MLIPIKHNPDFCTESRPSTNPRHRHPVRFVSPKLALELRKYQIALKQMHPGGVVFYEIAKAKGVHVHQQAVPIPQEKINNVENLREFFIKEAKECGFRMENNGELRDDQTNYFRIEFPNSDPIVIKLNRQNPKFDVTWPRKLLAQWFLVTRSEGTGETALRRKLKRLRRRIRSRATLKPLISLDRIKLMAFVLYNVTIKHESTVEI